MSQAYKVAQAFQATVSKEDKTPKTVTFDGHTFNAWKVKLVDQEEYGVEDKEWINVNKKPGNEIKPGDELYGDINPVNGKFGTFYNFKSASRPLGDAPAPQQASSAPVAQTDDETQDKLDHIIALLESIVMPEGVAKVFPGAKPAVDLDDLDI